MQEKLMPQDISAEQSVLGAMMIDTAAVALMADKLLPEDFYRPSHQILFRTMLALYRANKPVDMITIVDELKKNGQTLTGVPSTLPTSTFPAFSSARVFAWNFCDRIR